VPQLTADFELGVKENSGLDATGLGDLRKLSIVEPKRGADIAVF
jgi:hypothetical protein